jgi:predicted nuclease of predicted toxin-antitoxin system
VLVTLDKEFGELAILKGKPHSGIIRLAGISARLQGPLANQVLSAYGEELARGAICTLEPGSTRIRHFDKA